MKQKNLCHNDYNKIKSKEILNKRRRHILKRNLQLIKSNKGVQSKTLKINTYKQEHEK